MFVKKRESPKKTRSKMERLNKSVSATAQTKSKSPEKRRKSLATLPIATPESTRKITLRSRGKSIENFTITSPNNEEKVVKTPRKSLVLATPKSVKKRTKSFSISAAPTPKSLKKLKTVKKNEKLDEASQSENEDETLDSQKKFKIARKSVQKAVESVIKFTSENPKLKNQLFKEQFPLFLQVNSIKIPQIHSKIVRIPLKNSILSADSEICLIVPDVKGFKNKEHEKHLEHYEEILQKKGVNNIKKIMTFHEFRTEYETFELKSRLVELYDHFLVDGKISGKVVHKCGKIFYKKRKIPTPIKLQASKLKPHIEAALAKTPLYLHSKGDSFVVEFGNNQMSVNKLVENVYSVLEGLEKMFPGGFDNVRSANIYTFRGLTIPIYTTLKNQNEVQVPEGGRKVPKWSKTVQGELSTYLNTEVIVGPTGEITVLKGIDSDEEEASKESLNIKGVESTNKSASRKGKKRPIKEASEQVAKKKKQEKISEEPKNPSEKRQKTKEKLDKESMKSSAGAAANVVANFVKKQKKNMIKNLQGTKKENSSDVEGIRNAKEDQKQEPEKVVNRKSARQQKMNEVKQKLEKVRRSTHGSDAVGKTVGEIPVATANSPKRKKRNTCRRYKRKSTQPKQV